MGENNSICNLNVNLLQAQKIINFLINQVAIERIKSGLDRRVVDIDISHLLPGSPLAFACVRMTYSHLQVSFHLYPDELQKSIH